MFRGRTDERNGRTVAKLHSIAERDKNDCAHFRNLLQPNQVPGLSLSISLGQTDGQSVN